MEDNMKKKSEPLFDMDYFTCEGAPTMEEFIAHLDKIYSEN
jgi:hypothetical protein